MLRETYNYKDVINQYCALSLAHVEFSIGEENWKGLEITRDFF